MFRYKVAQYSARSKEQQRAEAQRWLLEWLGANSYCKSGYDIVSSDYQAWPHAFLDPVPIGGTVVTTGKCKPLNG